MIQEPIMELLSSNISGLIWSIDFRTASDNTGTVYYEGGASPAITDDVTEYPEYQIYIRSSDFDLARNTAFKVKELLHKKMDWPVEINTGVGIEKYHVYFIELLSQPLLLGVADNDIMEYSINIKVTLIKL